MNTEVQPAGQEGLLKHNPNTPENHITYLPGVQNQSQNRSALESAPTRGREAPG